MGVEETEEVEEKEEEEKPQKIKVSGQVKKIQIKGESSSAKASAFDKSSADKSEDKEWFEQEGELAVDVFQTDTDIIIQSTIAGVKPEELDLSIKDDMVTISGERQSPSEEEEKSYFYQECYWGPFSRQIILPEEVDFNQAEATMKDGIFTLRMPKLERKKVRKIKVRG